MDNMPNIIKIYKITNVINGKIYIGQTVRIGVQFDSYWGSGNYIKKAIKKYGKENFIKEIIMECDCQVDADEAEKFYIKEFNSTDEMIGYNLHIGGNTLGFGEQHPCFGKHQSEIVKEKHRKAGKNQWNKMDDCDKVKLVVMGGIASMNKLTQQEKIEKAKIGAKAFIESLTDEKRKQRSERMRKFALNQNKNMTPEQRSERARKAANALWLNLSNKKISDIYA